MNLLYKSFPSILLIAILSLYTTQTAAQNKCNDTVNINSFLTVYNFSFQDIDTVKVRLYNKGSKFKKPFDSFYVFTTHDIVNVAENNKRFINIGATKPITNMEDWEVILAGGKYVYKIADVTTSMQLVRHTMYKCQMKSFRLNGIKHMGSSISFSKPLSKRKAAK